MSTSLLYHAFGVVGYHYVGQSAQGGRVTLRIEQPRERYPRSPCGPDQVRSQGRVERTFHTLPPAELCVVPETGHRAMPAETVLRFLDHDTITS